VDLVPTIIGWVRLWGQNNSRFANLWGWTLGFSLHCLNIYASFLLKIPALINVQLGGVVLSLIWLGLIMRLRIKHNEPVGLPLWLVLTLIQRIKKGSQEKGQEKGQEKNQKKDQEKSQKNKLEKGWMRKYNYRLYRLLTFPIKRKWF
jgi:hypothetical protein